MIELIDEAFRGPSWHGPALLASLRGVTPALAVWRPAEGRHNIWEIAVHAAYWKYAARRRLSGERERFLLKGSNWFVRPLGDRTWKEDLQLLVNEHERLRDVIRRLPRRAFTNIVGPNGNTAAYTIRGAAAHDLYHAGQIQLLKRLQHDSPK
jgi:hypothetical protein